MNTLPKPMIDFLLRHHVVTLAAHHNAELWAASCFYAFDLNTSSLIVLTDVHTRHGKLMQNNPNIAGTIAAQPQSVAEIEGIQFSAYAKQLHPTDHNYAEALCCYLTRHPIAKTMKSNMWQLSLTEVKYTENHTRFGHKMIWQQSN